MRDDRSILARAALADLHGVWHRNIVAPRAARALFDDLSDDPAAWTIAERMTQRGRPLVYQSNTPIIDRPFEDAAWSSAIGWPFRHWQASRFSDGSYGVWYGSESIETTIYESAYHWVRRLLRDAGFEREEVAIERAVFTVACDGALIDLRSTTTAHPDLLHPSDYTLTHTVGARLHREGHPGLVIQSVRRPAGENIAVFNPVVLSDPQSVGPLTYRWREGAIEVERGTGTRWFTIGRDSGFAAE